MTDENKNMAPGADQQDAGFAPADMPASGGEEQATPSTEETPAM